MVLALDLEPGLVQLEADLGAQVGEVVDRRGREVAALVADLVATVVLKAPVFQAPASESMW
ncbi:hypothetical protein SANTM175S_02816 [Streptomyces antimycoticus]